MKIKQISLDIRVGDACDGCDLAYDIADELEELGYKVVGAGFQDDMTDYYEEHYPELLKGE